jgi:hypothetical protein
MFELTLLYHSGLHHRFDPTHTLHSYVRVDSCQGFDGAHFCWCGRSFVLYALNPCFEIPRGV